MHGQALETFVIGLYNLFLLAKTMLFYRPNSVYFNFPFAGDCTLSDLRMTADSITGPNGPYTPGSTYTFTCSATYVTDLQTGAQSFTVGCTGSTWGVTLPREVYCGGISGFLP